MGRYHGKADFDAFSFQRGVLVRSRWLDLNLRYPPYGDKVRLLKALIRFMG